MGNVNNWFRVGGGAPSLIGDVSQIWFLLVKQIYSLPVIKIYRFLLKMWTKKRYISQ